MLDYQRGGTQKNHYAISETLDWPCPLCDTTDTQEIKKERDVLGVAQCEQCSLIRIQPRLKHPHENYRGNPDVYEEEFRMVLNGKAPHHRDKNYLRDLERIESVKPTGNFLDIGTNAGSFLRLARNRGWNLTGVEPSPQLGALARKWWDLSIVQGFVEEVQLPSRNFDVVTMTDVFEHVVNPKKVLAAVRRLIKPDGLLFIKVPNGLFNVLKFRVRSLMGKNDTDDFDAYEHVVHYTDKTLTEMLRRSGFEVTDLWVEEPVQIPVWHHLVGHYYQHASPVSHAWKTYSARTALYHLARVEKWVSRRVGWLAPNIGCFARVAPN